MLDSFHGCSSHAQLRSKARDHVPSEQLRCWVWVSCLCQQGCPSFPIEYSSIVSAAYLASPLVHAHPQRLQVVLPNSFCLPINAHHFCGMSPSAVTVPCVDQSQSRPAKPSPFCFPCHRLSVGPAILFPIIPVVVLVRLSNSGRHVGCVGGVAGHSGEEVGPGEQLGEAVHVRGRPPTPQGKPSPPPLIINPRYVLKAAE